MLDGALHFSDGWTLVEDLLLAGRRGTGTLFTTSNGVVGVRGRSREPFGDEGLVLAAGCYETRPYAHPERSFGMPEDYQTIVPVTDPTGVAIAVDGVAVSPTTGTWITHIRTLDLRTGCVTTAARWRSPHGREVAIRTNRLVSFAVPELLWTSLEVAPADGTADVELALEMRANTSDHTFPDEPEALSRAWGRVLRPAGSWQQGTTAGLVHTTGLSGRAVACVADVSASCDQVALSLDTDLVERLFRGTADHDAPLVVCQRAALVVGDHTDPEALLTRAARLVVDTSGTGIDDALAAQRPILDRFWEAGAVDLEGDPEAEAAVRFSTFQVFQATARNPGRASPAKGLTGQGYEGHHLWDQEVYVGHALTFLAPEVARAILAFRVATLPEARTRARELSHDGAQFPWRTIDGREASAFFPAGAAQFHVNADIAWAIDHYVRCTGDEALLADGGLDVLVETARLWLSLGRFDDHGRFHIEGVTGPDEYTALVDDNLYTNLMVARQLERTATLVEAAPEPTAGDDEVARWRRAAAAMVVPYDESLGLHGQDATFLGRPRWDLAATPAGELPLQEHHHLLTLYRHQVIKQADLVLALFLLADAFTPEQRGRAFDYYEPLTTHDSSLSAPIHAIVAADLGRLDLAWEYARRTATGDLENRHGTLIDGVHLAAAAGAWLAVACGFGGLAVRDGGLTLRPQLPPGVTTLRFRLRYQDALLEVTTDGDGSTYHVVDGGPITFHHDGELLQLERGERARRG